MTQNKFLVMPNVTWLLGSSWKGLDLNLDLYIAKNQYGNFQVLCDWKERTNAIQIIKGC